MAYYDKTREEMFARMRNAPGIFSRKKKTVTYPDGVTRVLDSEPKSGRIVPKGKNPDNYVRVPRVAPSTQKVSHSTGVASSTPKPKPIHTPKVTRAAINVSAPSTPSAPVKVNQNPRKASQPPYITVGPTTVAVGGAAVAGAVGAALYKNREVKQSQPSTAPVASSPKPARPPKTIKPVALRVKTKKPSTPKVVATTPKPAKAPPKVQATPQVVIPKTSDKPAPKVETKPVSAPVKSAAPKVEEKKVVVPKAAPPTSPVTARTTKVRGKKVQVTAKVQPKAPAPSAPTVPATPIVPAKLPPPTPGKPGAHLGFAKSTARTTPPVVPSAAPAVPQAPVVRTPIKPASLQSIGKGAVIRKKGGTPLPVTTTPAPIAASLPKEQKAQELKGARAQQTTLAKGTKPGKPNVAAQQVLAKQTERKALQAELQIKLPTEGEMEKVTVGKGKTKLIPVGANKGEAVRRFKRAAVMHSQEGSAPVSVSKERAVALANRKAAIEAHMKTKGYTKVVGEGDEAKALKLTPETKSTAPEVKVPEPKATPSVGKAIIGKVKNAAKDLTDVRPETRYDPSAPLSSGGRFWWRKAVRGAKVLTPGLIALSAAEQASAAEPGQKFTAARRGAKESILAATGLAMLEKGAPWAARGLTKVLAPVGAAVGAYDIARAGYQAKEMFAAARHKARTEKHRREKYGTIALATKTRRERFKKRGG